jgi:hypothetical protein
VPTCPEEEFPFIKVKFTLEGCYLLPCWVATPTVKMRLSLYNSMSVFVLVRLSSSGVRKRILIQRNNFRTSVRIM